MFKNSNESVEKGEHIPQRKELLRLSQITESKGLSDTKKLQQSREIVQKIRHHPCWNESQSLLGFMPMRDEPDIFPLLQDIVERGKNLYLPQYQSESKTYSPVLIRDLKYDLIPGKFGILEPNPRCSIVNTSHMDLTLIPGLAFDSRGWRLGRGKGFMTGCWRSWMVSVLGSPSITNGWSRFLTKLWIRKWIGSSLHRSWRKPLIEG